MKQRTVKRGRKSARPPSHSYDINVRLSRQERELVESMARRADLEISAFVRMMIEVHAKIEIEIHRATAVRAQLKAEAVIAAITEQHAVRLSPIEAATGADMGRAA